MKRGEINAWWTREMGKQALKPVTPPSPRKDRWMVMPDLKTHLPTDGRKRK